MTPNHNSEEQNFPSNNTKCSGAFFSLRSEIVLITFSYWPAFQPAPIYLSTRTLALRYSPLRRQAIDAAFFPPIPALLALDLRCPHGRYTPLCTLCVCPISSCAKPSKGNMYVSNPVLLARNHRKYQQLGMYLLHYSALFLKRSTEGTHIQQP